MNNPGRMQEHDEWVKRWIASNPRTNQAKITLLSISWKSQKLARCTIRYRNIEVDWVLTYKQAPELRHLPVGEYKQDVWVSASTIPRQMPQKLV